MRYQHTNRNGFLLGTIDFFTAGIFFIFYMKRGLQQELDEIFGEKDAKILHRVPDRHSYVVYLSAHLDGADRR